MSCKAWNYKELGEIAEITKLAGFEFSKYIKYTAEGDIIAIRAMNVKNGVLDLENVQRIHKEVSDKLIRSKLFKGEIVLTYTGSNFGQSAIVEANDKYHLAPNVAKVTVNKENDSYFFYSYFQSYTFREQIRNYGGGSSQPTIPMKTIRKIIVPVPPIDEQRKIANVMLAINKKIQLNNEMNKTLEEIAQALFKRWFVDFEFPNEEGEPYKSSGGEMVESELGIIPKGWDVKLLYDIAEYINGTSFKAKDYCDKGLPIIKIAELKNGITNSTNFFQGEKDNKFYLKNRDILFSWSGNPDTSIDVFIWYKGEAILNQHIFKVVPNDEFGYCYTYILLKSLKSTFANIARNKQTTGLGHVTVKDLKELKIAVDSEKIKEFNLVLQPIINNIISNYSSLEILTELRESLLPKLMSGEIRVEDIEANL